LPYQFLLLTALLLTSATQAFTGSQACRSCHAQEYQAWQGSHHDLAMQLPDETTVLGDFDNTEFTYNGITTRFYRDGEKFMVRTDGEDGKMADFPVVYVFGVEPLQQYLLPLSRGRLQALSIAWDARPREAGGQRWYHLYPQESIDYKDPLHWTGPYQNWNTRCAECHSTDLHKNYNAKTRSFETVFEEIDVACEACHGPGDKHQELAVSGRLHNEPQGGFPTALQQRGEWAFPTGESIAQRRQSPQSNAQIDNCGRCHARRGTLGDYEYGKPLLDTHRLSLPLAPLYHHDGQILDEVYVYGSFVQSKMHQAGVVCSNCHEPHSVKLRAPNNGVCAQCHQPQVYDTPDHHRHTVGSTGALCAECHMPETTYMGVDPRRDHSMRVPRPDLSVVMGVPNACNQCHVDKDARWAVNATRDWGIVYHDTASHPARAFQQISMGDNRAVPALSQLATNTSAAPIWRASAMESLGQVGGRDALQAVTQLLYDDDPMIRTSTVRSLEFLPLHQRFQLLQPLFDDEVTSVRLEIAQSLAGVPLDQVSPEQSAALLTLYREYERIYRQHADMPGVQLQLGIFFASRQDAPSAEAAYREALGLNPQLVPAYLNLADLLRTVDRDAEARDLLLKCLVFAPDNGNTLHALGLLETRGGDTEKALAYLGRAAELETNGTRHRFVYAIALHDLGQPEQAIIQLQSLNRVVPQDEQVLLALVNYSAELGRKDQARTYAQKLIRIAPGNRNYQQLYQQLGTANTSASK